jgi:hypothetical protein
MLGVHVDVVSENGLSDDGTDDRQQEIRQQAIAI